jgi:hypothetical protein
MSWSFFVKLFHVTCPSIHGWHHTGKKTLTEINIPPSPRMCQCLGKVCLAPGGGGGGVWAPPRFSVARVPMNTCGMWYIERFWKCSCSYNFVICTVKYTHLCIRHGVQTSLVIIEIPWLTFITPGIIFAMAGSLKVIF